MSRAIVTGITGQDGGLLADRLLQRGYDVLGLVRAETDTARVPDGVEVEVADLLDGGRLAELLERFRPDELYNLAAPSFVPRSWEAPVEAAYGAGVAVVSVLEALRVAAPQARFFQASSSEMFGVPDVSPQDERTPIAPRSPYGAAKAYAHHMVGAYRERYGLFACSGILYNHESPRRPLSFLPRKVSRGVAEIALGLADELVLGDLGARRDWAYAGDVVEAMWLMLQQDTADDYVVASGESHSVEELVEAAFARAGLDWRRHVRVDESLVRAREAHELVGDPTRARERLGWSASVSFRGLVELLVDADLQALRTQSSSLPTTITGE